MKSEEEYAQGKHEIFASLLRSSGVVRPVISTK